MNNRYEIMQKLEELLLVHYPEMDTPGLFKGKMGACIYFFEAFHHNNDPKYRQAGESILQEVYTFIHQNPVPTYFDNGLAGIAWGIHRLIKKGFIEGNADELLEQVDHVLFRVISEKSEELEFGLKRGLMGYLLYVLDRLTPQPPKTGFHLSSELFISLAVLLLNRLHLMAETGRASFTEPERFHLFWDLTCYLWLMAQAEKLGIHTDKLKQMKKDLTPTVLSCLPQNVANRLNLYGAMECLSVTEWEHHTQLMKKGLTDISLSRFKLANKSLYMENGLAGLVFLDDQIKSSIGDFNGIFHQNNNHLEAIRHMEKSEYWDYLSQNLNHELGLLYGITGICFSMLQLSKENSSTLK